MCGNLGICELRTDPIFFVRFANLRFADPIFVADLQLPQICKFFIFLFTNTYLKCSNLNFYQVKNSAKQACSQVLDSFAIKGGNLKRDVKFSLSYGGKFEDLQFADLQFEDLQFADQPKEICGIADLRTCGCGFKKTVARPPLQICHRCQ
jgi:hypothetical protein